MKTKISTRTVNAIKPGDKDIWVHDAEVRGFGVKVRPSGTKEYFLRYSFDGSRHYKAIGIHGSPWTPSDARTEAKRILGQVADRKDPKEADKPHITVSELCDHYLAGVKSGKILIKGGRVKKDSTLATDEGRIERHIKPILGRKKVRNVTRKHIETFQEAVTSGVTAKEVKTGKRGKARVTGGAGTASRTLGLLGAIFAYAEKRGFIDLNPVRGVERRADTKKTRTLSEKDYAKIGKAIRDIRRESLKKEKKEAGTNTGRLIALDAIETLFLTGCRKSEILSLQSSQIDETNSCLRFADTKTGPQVRPIGSPALKFLRKLTWNKSDGYVFPATKGDGHNLSAPKVWNEIRERSGLQDVTLHTARHGYASIAAELGYTELTIAGLLGHSSHSVTKRYIHLVDSSLVAAAERVSATIARRMNEKRSKTSNVVRLRKR